MDYLIHHMLRKSVHRFPDKEALVERGRLRPVIHTVLPLAEAAAAQGIMDRSEHFGKIVLTV